jgi:hypothetical protein
MRRAWLALLAHSLEDRAMAGRGSRGKPRAPQPIPPIEPIVPARQGSPSVPTEDATKPIEMTAELLEQMRDESERPTVRMPVRPPFASPDDEEMARAAARSDKTVRARVLIGPDGVPRVLDEEELEEATRHFVPSKLLLGQVRAKKKKR